LEKFDADRNDSVGTQQSEGHARATITNVSPTNIRKFQGAKIPAPSSTWSRVRSKTIVCIVSNTTGTNRHAEMRKAEKRFSIREVRRVISVLNSAIERILYVGAT